MCETEDLEKWTGFYNAYKAALGNDATDEPWRVWRATQGEHPTDDEIAEFDGFVMSGSHYSAYEDLPWIQDNLEFIRKAYALATRRAEAGGEAERRPKRTVIGAERSTSGWSSLISIGSPHDALFCTTSRTAWGL